MCNSPVGLGAIRVLTSIRGFYHRVRYVNINTMHLTIVSYWFRRGIKGFGVFVILYYFMILLVIPVTKKGLNAIIPEKDPPNPIVGQLDALEFI